MRDSEQRRPQLRRLGDQLGAWYTPLALGLAVAAWVWSGDPVRFLAVLVVATPCPLLIAIPVAIIGAISLAAKRSIIVRDPAVLERIDRCRTIVLDKTGTLTYGEPTLTDRFPAPGMDDTLVLQLAASVERYSKHPLAKPILDAARRDHLALLDASEVRERPGEGLEGAVDGRHVRIVGRRQAEVAGHGNALAGPVTGTRMRDPGRRPVCGDIPISRCPSGRQPIVHHASWAAASPRARAARLRRSRE